MSDLFVRKATGMVRSWSVFDAFIYALFSINLITLGLYSFSQMYYFEGGMVNALIVSAIFIFFEVVVYAALIAVMPRSGGDYVWQSRILGGAVGFILAVTGWWFILWLWVPLYGDMFRHIVLVPLLGVFGAKDLALWFAGTQNGAFTASILTLIIVSIFIMLGMKTYARIQKFSFYAGMLGLLLVIGLLLGGSPEAFKAGLEANASSMFGATGVYDATVELGTAAGAITPFAGGSLSVVFLVIPYMVFFNLWPNWGATLYGEVRGATDFKRNMAGMGWALGATTLLGILLLYAIGKSVGWEFYVQSGAAWWNYAWGFTDVAPALPVWPYPALFAAFLTSNKLVQFLVLALMSFWWFGWCATVFLSSTRVIFAAAFDRLLPESVAKLDERTGTPVNALLLMIVPSILVAYLFNYNVASFASLTLCSTLVIAVTFLGTTISAIVLPYTKPELYKASPIAKYNILGIPMITVAGVIFGGFLVYLLYQWILDPNALYGIGYSINEAGYKNGTSLIFMGANYVLAAAIYFGFKSYRKSKGIDLSKVQAEIPVE
ncbi:MAG: APC family permease [Chloroflexi bacterium]|nr:APC family permease [Chloroflexota bacterium]MBI3167200.1 APC family permease [Chloroflexota bacterium]